MAEVRMPLVSVVVPAYNAVRWIEEALVSVTSQLDGPELDIIVVDDASTDRTAEVALAVDGRVRVVRQARGGRSGARNRGLAEARGEFIAFLDADDAYAPGKLRAQLDYLRQHEHAVAVLTSLERFGVDASAVHDPWTDATVRAFAVTDFLVRDVGHPASLLMRASATRGVGFPSGVHAVEDRIFLAQVRARGPIGFIDQPFYRYRTHGRPHFSSDGLRWHRFQSLKQWAEAEGAPLGLPVAEAQAMALRMLADELDAEYFARQFDTFEDERRKLRALWTMPETHPVFRRRLWPRWVFRCKDALDALRHPAQARPAHS